MSIADPSRSRPSRWSARKHEDDLSPLNVCASVILVLLLVPALFAGGGLRGLFVAAFSVLPPIGLAIVADRRGGPGSARVTFIAAGVFILMVALQLRG